MDFASEQLDVLYQLLSFILKYRINDVVYSYIQHHIGVFHAVPVVP